MLKQLRINNQTPQRPLPTPCSQQHIERLAATRAEGAKDLLRRASRDAVPERADGPVPGVLHDAVAGGDPRLEVRRPPPDIRGRGTPRRVRVAQWLPRQVRVDRGAAVP